MLKQLNGFKKIYLFFLVFLVFLVIELLLVVFGLSFTPLLSCLWFDFLFLVLFFHLWTIFYKKREFKFFHLILHFLSVILAFFIWFILQVSLTDSANTIIPPIHHNAEIRGNFVEIPHGAIPIRSRDYYELVNPFIMKLEVKYRKDGW